MYTFFKLHTLVVWPFICNLLTSEKKSVHVACETSSDYQSQNMTCVCTLASTHSWYCNATSSITLYFSAIFWSFISFFAPDYDYVLAPVYNQYLLSILFRSRFRLKTGLKPVFICTFNMKMLSINYIVATAWFNPFNPLKRYFSI